MTDRITLSAAEISFILSKADDDVQQAALRRLGIGPDEQTQPVRRAGLASLLQRELARADNLRYELGLPASAVYEGLTSARRTAELGFIASDRADGSHLFDGGAVRLFVAPRAHRIFEIIGLDSTASLRDQVSEAVTSFLRENNPGVVSVVVSAEWPAQPGQADSSVSVAANGDSWSFLRGGQGEERKLLGLSQDVALGHLSEALARLLSVPAA